MLCSLNNGTRVNYRIKYPFIQNHSRLFNFCNLKDDPRVSHFVVDVLKFNQAYMRYILMLITLLGSLNFQIQWACLSSCMHDIIAVLGNWNLSKLESNFLHMIMITVTITIVLIVFIGTAWLAQPNNSDLY